MPTPHKHAEVIKAWADGHEIQVRNKSINSMWVTIDSHDTIGWYSENEYRKKPEEVVDYTIVGNTGVSGGLFCSNIEDLSKYYVTTFPNRQGYMKRTRVDGSVVSLEFIKK